MEQEKPLPDKSDATTCKTKTMSQGLAVTFFNELFILEQNWIYWKVGKTLQKIPVHTSHPFLLMLASYVSLIHVSHQKTLWLHISWLNGLTLIWIALMVFFRSRILYCIQFACLLSCVGLLSLVKCPFSFNTLTVLRSTGQAFCRMFLIVSFYDFFTHN